MNSLEKKGGKNPGGVTQLQCHKHSSLDAVHIKLAFLLDKNEAAGHRY